MDRRAPFGPAASELFISDSEVDGARLGIDADDITIANQRDRAAIGGFGADMTDAEAACRAREASIGDECDLVAHTLTIKGGGGRQHFPHARPTLGTFVADDENLTLAIRPILDRAE